MFRRPSPPQYCFLVSATMERAEKVGEFYHADVCDGYTPAHQIEDKDQERRILHILREGSVEDFEELKTMLAAPSIFVPGEHVSRRVFENDLLAIIDARGIEWLNRALDVADFNESVLYGLAIAEDSEHTEAIHEAIMQYRGVFEYNQDHIVDAVAGHENSVEHLNKWVPHILNHDFAADTHHWDFFNFLSSALSAGDNALRDALYSKRTPEALMDMVFRNYGMFLYACDREGNPLAGEPTMVHVLDLVQDVLQPLVLAEDARVERLKRNCMHVFQTYNKEPDPEVMTRLTRRAAKSAAL